MGNSQTVFNRVDKVGYQVTSVSRLSPGAECGLKATEDYIVKINGASVSTTEPDLIMGVVQVSVDNVDLALDSLLDRNKLFFIVSYYVWYPLFQTSVNRPVRLDVYSAKTKSFREVKLTPNTRWPGEGLLGIKMKLTTYDISVTQTARP